MTGPERNHPSAEDGFERIEAAYRGLSAEEPPDLLDQAVLNAARRAAAGKSERPWNFGWIHALSTAAVVVLGVALVMQSPEAPGPEPLRVSKPPSGKLRDIESETEPLAIPAPPQKAPIVREMRRVQRPQQSSTAVADAAREDTRELREEAFRQAKQESDQSVPDTPSAATEAGLAAEPALGMTASMADEVSADKAIEAEVQAVSGAPWRKNPESWLKELERLRQAGDEAAFEAELAVFREAWPDHPLPEDWPG